MISVAAVTLELPHGTVHFNSRKAHRAQPWTVLIRHRAKEQVVFLYLIALCAARNFRVR